MSIIHSTQTRLSGSIVPVGNLSPTQRDAMFELMCRSYADIRRVRFERDLRQKRWCLLLQDPDGVTQGFSTQTLLTASVGGRDVRALYSGDTIIDRAHWGTPALAVSFLRLAVALIEQHEGERLFWFLTTKGYRTYRYLPVFFREFYPRWDLATPDWARALVDALALRKYPLGYDPTRGVVDASTTGYRLRHGVADISEQRLRNPHVRFFQERNRRHAKGDELCCVAPLALANFTSAGARILRSKRFRDAAIA